MGSFIQNNIILPYDESIYQIFYPSKPAKNDLSDILLKKNMAYERNVRNAAHGKLLILFSLIIQKYLKMVIILNVKNAVLLVRKSKEVFYARKNLLYTVRQRES